ncbi:MAG: sterol desaturase family protein [Nevskiales bacterium]
MENLVLYAIPAFLLLVAAESSYASWRGLAVYDSRDAFASLAMGVGNVFVQAFCKICWLAIYWLAYEHRLFEIPLSSGWAWALLLIGDDFFFYWYHRASHRINILWAAHVNHHSSERFNLTTALRQSWTTPVYSFAFYLPLAWLGFHPLMIMAAASISLIYQFWIHTELIGRLGPLEWALNTPSHHRVHHGANPQYIDKNYGGMLIVWDRLFGSFVPEADKVRFGLVKNIHSYNPIKIAFHQWVSIFRKIHQARSWREALGHLFRGPEWDPPSARSAQLGCEAMPGTSHG